MPHFSPGVRSRVMRTARFMLPVAAAIWLAAPFSVWSQAFPAKPIRMVTQFVAGSGGDVATRIVASAMSEVMGQPVVIENRAGAGGVLAAEFVARAAPDGYTILAATPGTQVMRIFLAKSTPFDPIRDFTPITAVGESLTLIVAHPAFAPNSFRELLDFAKRNPGKVAFGTSGIGSQHHLSAEQIRQLTGADMMHVPYKSGAQALQEVVSGQIPVSYSISGPALPQLAAGKIKVLAVVSDARYRRLPDVPTVNETVPDFVPPPGWTGLFAPAGLPQAILKRLNADIVKAITAPEIRAKLGDAGFEVIANTPEDFGALIRRQVELVGRIVKAAGIQPTD